MKRIICLGIFIIVASHLFGQLAVLTISVTDSSGNWIQGAQVKLVRNDTTIYTGFNGTHRIPIYKFLDDTIVISFRNLGSQTVIVSLQEKESRWIDVKLPKPCSSLTRTDVCPKCGSNKDVMKIIYGLPSDALMEKANKGLVHLGGCVVSDCSPVYYCKKDDLEF
jgi:hypothetical protein